MKKTPADALMDTAEWVACEPSERGPDNIPVVTHTGAFTIAGLTMECVQLDDGRRLITEKSMLQFIEALQGIEEYALQPNPG